jgi:ribosomal protein L11 methyltransferase
LPEAEEAVAELLETVSGVPVSTYTDLETGGVSATVHLSSRPDWRRLRASLVQGLRDIEGCGLRVGRRRLSLTKVSGKEWAESWKKHFKPLEIGRALLVKPSWSRRTAKHGQALVVLDPGLSFGTGQHPTTSFCLEELAACRTKGVRQSFLDVGTGSGILAIAAAKLGYGPVEAIDFDPDAVRIAGENARRNSVAAHVRIRREDVRRLPWHRPKKYSVVCANLVSSLLLEERDRLLGLVESGGVLVLAGILGIEFSQVRAAFEAAGLRLNRRRRVGEWESGSFCFK